MSVQPIEDSPYELAADDEPTAIFPAADKHFNLLFKFT